MLTELAVAQRRERPQVQQAPQRLPGAPCIHRLGRLVPRRSRRRYLSGWNRQRKLTIRPTAWDVLFVPTVLAETISPTHDHVPFAGTPQTHKANYGAMTTLRPFASRAMDTGARRRLPLPREEGTFGTSHG